MYNICIFAYIYNIYIYTHVIYIYSYCNIYLLILCHNRGEPWKVTQIPPAKPGVEAMAMAGPVPMERPKIITESWRSHLFWG